VRLISRFVGLALVILAAFWFTALNASELVSIDLVFLRVRVSLPLVLFGSVLVGMGLSLLVGWWADRRAGRRLPADDPSLLQERPEFLDAGTHELDVRDPERTGWR